MGQKVNANIFRVTKKHKERSKARWYASRYNVAEYLAEDYKIRQFIKNRPSCKDVVSVVIGRSGHLIKVQLEASRSGLIIGRQGVEVEALKSDLSRLLGKEVFVEVKEIKNPALSAQWVAMSIARGLKKRERSTQLTRELGKQIMKAGAAGYRIAISGRHGGAEMAKTDLIKEGATPLHTIRSFIDYSPMPVVTNYGVMGIKVWICHGDYQVKKSHSPIENVNA